MKTILCVIALAALALAATFDVDVSGKWTGTAVLPGDDGGNRDSGAFLNLKQSGNEVTGTAGPNEEEQHPVKGTIEGDKILLSVEAGEEMTIKIELAVSGDRLKGKIMMQRGGETRNGTLDVGRAK